MTSKSGVSRATSAAEFSMIALNLDSAEQAVALGKKVAENSGRTVTVRDAHGEVLAVFQGATKN